MILELISAISWHILMNSSQIPSPKLTANAPKTWCAQRKIIFQTAFFQRLSSRDCNCLKNVVVGRVDHDTGLAQHRLMQDVCITKHSQTKAAWICIKCLEQVKHILPNGGLMMIYLGKKEKNITIKASPRSRVHAIA